MKKIMFNERYRLNQAVLEEWKTQTRRIVSRKILDLVPQYQEEYYARALESISVEDAIYNITHGEKMAKAPFYVGEEIAIAQSYRDEYSVWEILKLLHPERPPQVGDLVGAGWRNKMFVRAHLMHHRIRITNVRVERLQDISDEDCLKEGIEFARGGYYTNYNKEINSRTWLGNTPKEAFAALIDKTCGKGTWDSNPWVFVYDFELVK